MTRFARSKGSKASNEKRPEPATSWEEMKSQLLNRAKSEEDEKNRVEALERRNENYKKFLSEREEEESKHTTWAEFNSDKTQVEVEKKRKSTESSDSESITKISKKSKLDINEDADSDEMPEECSAKEKPQEIIVTKSKKKKATIQITSHITKQPENKETTDIDPKSLKKIKMKQKRYKKQLEKKLQKRQEKRLKQSEKGNGNIDQTEVEKANLTPGELQKIEKEKQEKAKEMKKIESSQTQKNNGNTDEVKADKLDLSQEELQKIEKKKQKKVKQAEKRKKIKEMKKVESSQMEKSNGNTDEVKAEKVNSSLEELQKIEKKKQKKAKQAEKRKKIKEMKKIEASKAEKSNGNMDQVTAEKVNLSPEELQKIEKKKLKKARQAEKRKKFIEMRKIESTQTEKSNQTDGTKSGEEQNKGDFKKTSLFKNNKIKKVKDNKNGKRHKPTTQSIFINGKTIELDYMDGFPIKKEDGDRLKSLKKEMIAKGLPRSEINVALKLERRRAEKALAREKKKVCFNCRKSGHNLSECPELGKEELAETTGTGICFKCGSTEHTHFECKVVRGEAFKFAQCFICNEKGHIARQCPDNQRGLYPKGGACRVCGDVTHLKKDCPKYQIQQKQLQSDWKLETLDTQNPDVLESQETNVMRNIKRKSTIIKF